MTATSFKASNSPLRTLRALALAGLAVGALASSPLLARLEPTAGAAVVACAGPDFAAPRVFNAANARSLAVADVNRDGRADLLVANNLSSGRVSVHLGDGGGGFSAGAVVTVGRRPVSVVSADFDLDGNPDFATANVAASPSSPSASVRFGDGAGAFPRSKSLTFGIPSSAADFSSVTAGDFNLDGKPDIAATDISFNSVVVFLGNGAGDFEPARGYAVGLTPYQVVVGDFNGDAKPDLAATNSASGNVSVLLGDGSGVFAAATNFPAGAAPLSLVAGDFNGDGRADLANANGGAQSVSVLLGNGDGGFGAATEFAVGSAQPDALTTGDYDGDGDADLVVTTLSLNNAVVLRGDGAGGFAAAANFLTGGRDPQFVLTHDFNGDGLPDLAVANQLAGGRVSVLLNSCASGPAPASVRFSDAGYAVFDEAGGFGGNGHAAITVVRTGGLSGAGSVSYATSDGTATSPADYAATAGTLNFADGETSKTFLVPVVNDNISEGDETASLTLSNAAGALSLGDPAAAALTILANDGKPRVSINDLSVAEGQAGTTTAVSLTVSLSNPSSSTVTVSYATGGGTATAGADYVAASGTLTFNPGELSKTVTVTVNGDQESEISEAFDVLLSNPVNADIAKAVGVVTINEDDSSCPAPSFGAATDFASGGTDPGPVVAADFNNDGNPDFAVGNINGGSISVRLGNGAGGFGAATNFPVGYPISVVTGDFNRDGKIDLASISGDAFNGKAAVMLGDGAGNFAAPSSFNVGESPRSLAVGDFNGDAKQDLAVANINSRNVSVLLGDGAAGFAAPVNYGAGLSPFYVAAGDFNGDGKTDLAVANLNSHIVALLAGDGAGRFAPAGTFLFNGNPVALAVSDFNGDGKTDLAVAVNLPHGVTVLAGDGVGGFMSRVSLAVGERPNHVTAADFNGDGRADLAAANYGPEQTAGTVSVLFGNGAGNFSAASNFAVRNNPYATAAADFDKNGRLDLVVSNARSNSVSLLLNTCPTAASPTVQFGAAAATVGESSGRATLTVTRTGDVSGAAAVDYATADSDTFTVGCADAAGAQGAAYARCDFATSVGTINFAPGETSKTVAVPVIDDGHDEGDETFQLRLSSATGTTLGSLTVATVTIQDNDGAAVPNPVVASKEFFVRQQYLDFLSREPDAGGFNAWLNVLNNCANIFTGPEVQSGCDRIHVSGEGFYRSVEFQFKGAYAFRFYKVAFNRLPEYLEIVSDMSFVAGATEAEVYARRAQLAERFVGRPEFGSTYGALSNGQYVAALLGRYNLTQIVTRDPGNPDTGGKVTLTAAELTGRLDAGTLTRAQVLRAVVDSDEVNAAEFDNAFVAMQYYGYLRRKPEPSGYEAWLRVLRSGDVRTMVDGFLNSAEYKLRFGQP